MTTETTSESTAVHGGRLVARRLAAHGVTKLFTLSGGHLFSVYDGCREEGIDIVDVRHESAAAFAAEGWAKVTREPGVCALTAGPGVTNGMSALGSALQNHSPMLVLGGRGEARERPHERHVVDLLQRALAPAQRGRAASEHEHRRVVLQRGAERAHPVGHPRAGRQRAHAGRPRDLRPALGRERRARLVAHVDDVDALLATAVVDREQVPARERE